MFGVTIPDGHSDRHTRNSLCLVIYSRSSVGEIRQGEIPARAAQHYPLDDSIDDHIDHCHGYSIPDELTGLAVQLRAANADNPAS